MSPQYVQTPSASGTGVPSLGHVSVAGGVTVFGFFESDMVPTELPLPVLVRQVLPAYRHPLVSPVRAPRAGARRVLGG